MNRFGRHRAWAGGSLLGGLLLPLLIIFQPQTEAFMALMVIWTIITATFVAGYVAPAAMIGDVIDYDTLKTGTNRSAQYYALLTLVSKASGAAGAGLGFLILHLFHYDATKTIHDATSVFGIKFVISFPAVLLLLVAIVVWFFPIDKRRQRIIKRRIESRAKRAQRAARALEVT